MIHRHPAVLILGPTGSGKTPLGDALATHGLAGRRAGHFDFGQNLRDVDAGRLPPGPLTPADLSVIHQALVGGALLENENFPIAARLLEAFCQRHQLAPEDGVILNGLPRHLGQAADTDRLVRLQAVIHLECPADVVYSRIRANSGGDRTHRTDDSLAEIEQKLLIFRQRTLPLLDHYRTKSVRVIPFPVGVTTQPQDILAALGDTLDAKDTR